MPIEDEKLYEEIGRAWRHFASWREKAFGGYLTVLAALAVGFYQNRSLPVRTVIFAGALLVSAVFWILDVRNLQLMNACQLAANRLECNKGCYAGLNRVRFERKRSPSHGLAINLLVDGVGAVGVAGLCTCFMRWYSEGAIPWPMWQPLVLGVGALAGWRRASGALRFGANQQTDKSHSCARYAPAPALRGPFSAPSRPWRTIFSMTPCFRASSPDARISDSL